MSASSIQVTFDAVDPVAMADFWAGALGYEVEAPPADAANGKDVVPSPDDPEGEDGWGAVAAAVHPEGTGPRLLFLRVTEQKVAKNRIRLDVNVSGPAGTPLGERRVRVDETVDRLVACGARMIRPYEQHGDYWVVMYDPEGNEFCVQ